MLIYIYILVITPITIVPKKSINCYLYNETQETDKFKA